MINLHPSFWTYQRTLWAIGTCTLLIPDSMLLLIPLWELSANKPPLYLYAVYFFSSSPGPHLWSFMRDYLSLLYIYIYIFSRQHIFLPQWHQFFIMLKESHFSSLYSSCKLFGHFWALLCSSPLLKSPFWRPHCYRFHYCKTSQSYVIF